MGGGIAGSGGLQGSGRRKGGSGPEASGAAVLVRCVGGDSHKFWSGPVEVPVLGKRRGASHCINFVYMHA